MRRLRALALLAASGVTSSACATILGYDSGSAEPASPDGATDGPGVDGAQPEGAPAEGAVEGSREGDDAPAPDSPLPDGADVSSDVPPVDGPMDSPVDMPIDMPPDNPVDSPQDASLTCSGCPGGTTVLYTYPIGAGTLRGIAVDANYAYWALDPGPGGSIVRCNKALCTSPLTVASTGAVDDPRGVALNGNAIFWSNYGSMNGVYTCGSGGAGCATPTQYNNLVTAEGLAYDSTINMLLYVGLGTGDVKQCSAVGSGNCLSPGTGLPTAPVNGVVSDDSMYVYWGYAMPGPNNIWRSLINWSTSDTQLNGDADPVYGMAYVAGSIYYVTQNGTSGSIKKCAPPMCSGTSVVASGLPSPVGLAGDTTTLYVTASSSTLTGVFTMPRP